MNAHTEIAVSPLAKLREPFPPNQISKLPKESRKQIDERKNRVHGCMVWDCPECGNAHHKDAVHLDYVGHAAATDRLLDTDPEWSWEPLAVDQRGLPAFDENGGLWIRLTVCGVTRLGYGSADGKSGGDAKKEIIGDAIRNAGMRFGMALDLWHKGDLHIDEDDVAPKTTNPDPAARGRQSKPEPKPDDIEPAGGWGDWARALIDQVSKADTDTQLDEIKNDPANKARINATRKIDKTMYDDIAKAFADRRAVLADEVPF